MNARAFQKILMKGRVQSFWGRRAYLSVWVPYEVFGGPPPKFDESGLGEPDVFGGHWLRKLPDGRQQMVVISNPSGPRPEQDDPRKAYMFEPYDESDPDYGTWWEGVVYENRDIVENLPEELVRAYAARRDWFYRNIHGSLSGMDEYLALSEAHRAFLDAGTWAKTVYETAETRGGLVLTFSVKWFYPERKRGFCAAMHRLSKLADIKVRRA